MSLNGVNQMANRFNQLGQKTRPRSKQQVCVCVCGKEKISKTKEKRTIEKTQRKVIKQYPELVNNQML